MDAFYDKLMKILLPDFDERGDNKKHRAPATAIRAPNMQAYVERRLTEVHYSAVDYRFCDKFIAIVISAFLIVMIPYLHIGVFYLKIWVPDKPAVDRQACTCSCFDTVFRGSYEMPGLVTYKHVYFNATANTFKIWVITVVFFILFYESIKYLVSVYRTSSFRIKWLILYLINLYPHYYSWWCFFSYYNEEFYAVFSHHMFFTVTELFTTAIVLNQCNKNNEIKAWKVMAILAISLVHIIVSGSDQFISHVLQGRGTNFQNARNLGLMIPDIFHIIIPGYEFYKFVKFNDSRFSELCYKEEIIMFIVFITIGVFFGRIL